MNKTLIMGRISKELELRATREGNKVLSFPVAVRRPYTKDKTDFFDCVAWDKNAEFISQYFRKGDGIAIEEYLIVRGYEDNTGSKRKVTELVVEKVYFPPGKSATAAEAPSAATEFEEIGTDEDLPFREG